jgi:hypothetical protein
MNNDSFYLFRGLGFLLLSDIKQFIELVIKKGGAKIIGENLSINADVYWGLVAIGKKQAKKQRKQ